MNKLKKLSLYSIGVATLTLGSILNSHAQGLQAETLQKLNLRTGPSTNNSIILTIAKGSTIEVLENSDIWAIVKYNGTVGYVSSQYIKEQLPVIKPSPKENNNNNVETILMECNVSSLNVRKGPSTSESILGKIDKTDRVYVVYQTSNGWSRIKYNNGYGYVSSQYLIKVNSNDNSSSNELSQTKNMLCNTNSLNVRKGPSTSQSVVSHLNKSDKVTVVKKLNNNWSKIRFKNQFGYVSSQYLSAISSTPVANNLMKCDTYMLNVRKGPSSYESIVGNLRNGDKVEIVYHLNSGWTRIKFKNQFAYVSTTYLTNL